jgi:hypothetical protein
LINLLPASLQARVAHLSLGTLNAIQQATDGVEWAIMPLAEAARTRL